MLNAKEILDHFKKGGIDRMGTRDLITQKLKEGLPVREAMQNMPSEVISEVGMELISFGADPTEVASYMSDELVEIYLEALLEAGTSPDNLVWRVSLSRYKNLELLARFKVSKEVFRAALSKCTPQEILPNLKWLILNEVFDRAETYELIEKAPIGIIEKNLEQLLWAVDDFKPIFERLVLERRVSRFLDLFYTAGVTAEEILRYLRPQEVIVNFEWLVSKGLTPSPNFYLDRVIGNLESSFDPEVLLIFGASPFLLAQKMTDQYIDRNLDLLIAYGLNVEVAAQRILTAEWIIKNLDRIQIRGAALRRVVSQTSENTVAHYFTALLDAGMSVRILLKQIESQASLDSQLAQIAQYPYLTMREKRRLLRRFSPSAIVRNLELLEECKFPIRVQDLAEQLSKSELESHLEELYELGAELDFESIARGLDSWQTERHLMLLFKVGVDATFLADRIRAKAIAENLETFLELGVNPNILALKLDPADRMENREILLAHGARMWLE